jgi:hypothetical protein
MSKEIDPVDEVIIGLLQGKDLEKEVRRVFFSKEADDKEEKE